MKSEKQITPEEIVHILYKLYAHQLGCELVAAKEQTKTA